MSGKIFVPLFILLLLAADNLRAQLPDLPIVHDSLYSEVLKEMRPLEIVLPAGYSSATKDRYDALYLTDGEWNTRIASNIRQFLNIQFIPENIIVSIPNVYPKGANQRGRDFTPTHSDGMPESGGAAKFLSFIKTELVPYINKKYKTNGENTLYGSSLGGIFAMYALCKEPELFQSYLMADPAWWWDNNYISQLVKENLDKLEPMNKTLLITGREGAPYQYMGIAKVDSLLAPAKANGAHWKTVLYNDETHNAMIFRTIYDGLKYTYAGYMKEDFLFHPMNGMLLPGKPVTLHLNNTEFFKDLHYAVDGKTPAKTANKVNGDSIVLTGTAQLVVTSFSNREKYSKTVKGNFMAVPTPLPASGKPKGMQPGGFAYRYYEGVWDSLPDFKNLQPSHTGLAGKDFNMRTLPRQHNFSCVLEGQLEIKTDGYYMFGIAAAGGAKLFVGKQLLIDYNGIHNNDNFQSSIVPLTKGFYPIRMEYFQKEGNPSFDFGYITPEMKNPGPIPMELVYSTSKK